MGNYSLRGFLTRTVPNLTKLFSTRSGVGALMCMNSLLDIIYIIRNVDNMWVNRGCGLGLPL